MPAAPTLYDKLASLTSSQLQFLVNRLDLDSRFLTSSAPPATIAAEVYAQVQQRGDEALTECKYILEDIVVHSAQARRKALDAQEDNVVWGWARRYLWMLLLVTLLAGPIVSEVLAGRWPKVYATIIAVAIATWIAYLQLRPALSRASQVSSSEVLSTFVDKQEPVLGFLHTCFLKQVICGAQCIGCPRGDSSASCWPPGSTKRAASVRFVLLVRECTHSIAFPERLLQPS